MTAYRVREGDDAVAAINGGLADILTVRPITTAKNAAVYRRRAYGDSNAIGHSIRTRQGPSLPRIELAFLRRTAVARSSRIIYFEDELGGDRPQAACPLMRRCGFAARMSKQATLLNFPWPEYGWVATLGSGWSHPLPRRPGRRSFKKNISFPSAPFACRWANSCWYFCWYLQTLRLKLNHEINHIRYE